MSIDNLPGEQPGPVDDAPKSEAQLVEDIGNLLDDDPETDLADGKEDQAKAEADPDDPEIDVSEDVEDEADADDPDGSQEAEIKGGRFAPDSAKVTLEDGTVITVADLKRNNLFQRDYTKKTTELAAEREQITTRKSEVDQQAQSLTQLAEYLDWYSQSYLPKPPEPFQGTPDTDPIGYMRYMQQAEEFNKAESLRAYFRNERGRLTQQAQEQSHLQSREAFAQELHALAQAEPAFWGDTAKMKTFVGELVEKGGEWWGLSKEDIATFRTQKHWKLVRDAMRYRKALAKAPEVQKQVQAKPAVAIGGRRADPKARVNAQKQARSERLRATGSFEDGVAAIEDLIP